MSAREYNDPQVLREIWTAAYAVAFVTDFRKLMAINSFDRALSSASAEAAGTIANRAVDEWVRWNEEGK